MDLRYRVASLFGGVRGQPRRRANRRQEWLNALWDQVASSSIQSYYDDSLKLISMIVMSGNWWSPTAKM